MSYKSRKKYDREFKRKAVELSFQNEDLKKLAADLDILPSLLYRWRREFIKQPDAVFSGNGNANLTPEANELAKLKKQLAEVQMERDILKKAAGIFSKSDGKAFNS
ncbi:MAG: transposase [Saprospiraceae bacterium]